MHSNESCLHSLKSDVEQQELGDNQMFSDREPPWPLRGTGNAAPNTDQVAHGVLCGQREAGRRGPDVGMLPCRVPGSIGP